VILNKNAAYFLDEAVYILKRIINTMYAPKAIK